MVNMYLPRLIEPTLSKAEKTFPAIVICGPRQSGKSTLLANYVKTHSTSVLSLDNPEIRRLLLDDPRGILARLPKPVVLDEIQYTPEIVTYVKLLIDEDRQPGQWFITGSQQFSVMKNVSESLAGRAAVFSLPPFSLGERHKTEEIGNFLLRGGYPELIINPQVDRDVWYASYLQTYIERDVRMLLNITDLRDFEQFLRLLAAHTGQEMNMSILSRRLGNSVPTIKRWISVLEASMIIFLLPPFFENFGKRIVKSPKLYFWDTGLVNHLVGIREENVLLNGPMAGAIFETAIVSEIMKSRMAQGIKPSLYFWRSQSGLEIDLIEQQGNYLVPYEIKLSTTIKPGHYKNLVRWLELTGQNNGTGYLVSNCDRPPLPLPAGIRNIYWQDIR
jgi:predicted AAA+ superfamily ATPase